jgi:hypothetical protein
MERLIAERDHLPAVYIRNGGKEKHASIALTLMSAVTDGSQDVPRVAITRYYRDRGSSAFSFATSEWTEPVLSGGNTP